MTAPAPSRKPTELVTLSGFLGYWVLRGIARQIGVDARCGALSARWLFRQWVRHKWRRVPRPIRVPVFAVGVTTLAGYRAGRYTGLTVAAGTEWGLVEGWYRHGESRQLRDAQRALREHRTRARETGIGLNTDEHTRLTRQHEAARANVAAARAQRAEWSTSQVRAQSRAIVAKIPTVGEMNRADRRAWRSAEGLVELGEVTARWLEGDVRSHPNGYRNGPDPETAEITPALAVLNRSGFVTIASQPGGVWNHDGQTWRQRAAVEGFADKATADRLETACRKAGLLFGRHDGASRRMDYRSAVGVTDCNGSVHTSFGARLSRRHVALQFDGYAYHELIEAEQVTIIDPEWGRNDRLWSTVAGPGWKDTPKTETGPQSSIIPQYPGPDDGSPGHAQRLAAWQQWRAQQGGVTFAPTTDREHSPNRTWDGKPETPAETRFFDLRESGYEGWIDQDGYAVACPSCGEADCTKGLTEHDREASEATMFNDRTMRIRSTDHGGFFFDDPQDRENRADAMRHGYGGAAMTTPSNTGGGDVVSIADLRDVYERTAGDMASVLEQQSAAAARFRAQAASYEVAVGGLTAEGHDADTIAEAAAVMEAMTEAARRADEAAAAAEAAYAAIGSAGRGLVRHRPMEEAVASHPGVARRTAAYAPR